MKTRLCQKAQPVGEEQGEEDQEVSKEIVGDEEGEINIMLKRCTPFIVVLLAALGALCASASAQPGWELNAFTKPTYLRPGGRGGIVIRVLNIGSASSAGAVTVTDRLPPGVVATRAGGNHGVDTGGQ